MREEISWNGLPMVIFGTKGISREVLKLIEDINLYAKVPVFSVLGFVDRTINSIGKEVSGNLTVVSCDSNFSDYASKFTTLGVALPQGDPKLKRKIFDSVLNSTNNIVFPNLIHPSAIFHSFHIEIGVGNIITAGVITNIGIRMGNFNLINTGANIGHDVKIGNFCTINGLTSISGEVEIGNEVLVGTGASIIQRKKIGNKSVVSMGSAVLGNVPDSSTAIGVPAKIIRKL